MSQELFASFTLNAVHTINVYLKIKKMIMRSKVLKMIIFLQCCFYKIFRGG